MKTLFVCLGNICRSPLGEGIILDLAKKHGVPVTADSAGTASYHIGERPDRRSVSVAHKFGIDIREQRSRQFTAADFDAFDIIFAMDESNLQNINSLASGGGHRAKVVLLREFDQEAHGDLNVPDPYYGGADGFRDVFLMIQRSCLAFLRQENLV